MTMIVNYKRGMIKSYFADLEKDYTVDFIDEDVFMGTGGGLCPVSYTHLYPHEEGQAVDGAHVAQLTGQDPAKVFKTLVTQGADHNYYVFVDVYKRQHPGL